MAYRYSFTPLAVADIDDALDYISGVLLNPEAADNLYHSIQSEIVLIRENPYAFPDCSYYAIEDSSIRHSVIGNYVLVFEVSEAAKEIRILRFLYGRRDIAHMKITEEG